MASLKGWAGRPNEEGEGKHPFGPNHFHVLHEQLQLKEQEEIKKREEEIRKEREKREEMKKENQKKQEQLYYKFQHDAQIHQF